MRPPYAVEQIAGSIERWLNWTHEANDKLRQDHRQFTLITVEDPSRV